MEALIVDLLSHYAASWSWLSGRFSVLWLRHDVTEIVRWLVAAFALVVTLVPFFNTLARTAPQLEAPALACPEEKHRAYARCGLACFKRKGAVTPTAFLREHIPGACLFA